jgi:UDP-N-acetylmuramyl pentapeptide phosphotransferase/UDP-N-acetylglucosamine-1-phosphate transferase
LAGGQAAASFLGIAIASWSLSSSQYSLGVGAACLGFLLHNWAPASIFMGDVGSGFLGFSISALPFLAPAARRGDAVFAVAVGLGLFLLDPLETLARRFRSGQRLTLSHREHRYQGLIDPGADAGSVAGALVAAGVVLSLLGALSYRNSGLQWICVMAVALAFLTECVVGRGRQRRVDSR